MFCKSSGDQETFFRLDRRRPLGFVCPAWREPDGHDPNAERLRSDCDTQHLPGYSLLLCDDESVNHLTDLDWEKRKIFLFDLSLLGEAVQTACRSNGLRRPG